MSERLTIASACLAWLVGVVILFPSTGMLSAVLAVLFIPLVWLAGIAVWALADKTGRELCRFGNWLGRP